MKRALQHLQVSAAADKPRDAVPHAHRVVHRCQQIHDGQCDKLVTVVGHQFITLNVHLS